MSRRLRRRFVRRPARPLLSQAFAILTVLLVAATLGSALPACGDQTSAELDRQQLRLELLALKASLAGVSSLSANATVQDARAAITQTRAAWEAIAANAAVIADPRSADVQAAWADLTAALDGLSGNLSLREALPQVRDEINALKAAFDALYRDLR